MTNFLTRYQGRRVLVLGGTGFIGSSLVTALQSVTDITVVSRKYFKHQQNIQLEVGDITQADFVEQIVGRKFDIIFNCTGFSGIQNCQMNPLLSHKINVQAVKDLFESIRKFSPSTKVVMCGSRLEYGGTQYLPVDEHHPTKPLNVYGCDKLESTELALCYHSRYHLPVTVLRISNVYGNSHDMHWNGYNVINSFINLAANNKNLSVYGSGLQLRDYLHIQDLVQAMLITGISAETNGEIYNIGFGKSVTFIDMVKEISKYSNSQIVHENWPTNGKLFDYEDYVSDISKFSTVTGWRPSIDIKSGIKELFTA